MDTIRKNSGFIKILLFINILLLSASSQDSDSLYWFNMNSLREERPEFPLVINKVLTGDHIYILDSIKQSKSEVNEGFRIQIFESMISSMARTEAKRFQNILGDTIYIDYETPLYKLRIGNYIDRKDAERAINRIERLGAKDSWIVRTKIDIIK